ncbi:MAG: 16S rRNA (guanine(527)-N(7))-methyltransferase RsmG [Rikenellaceae bacterium]
MSENSVKLLEKYFSLTDSQRTAYESMRGVYEKWNSQINVISRKDIDNFYTRHVLHSLAVAKVQGFESGQRVLDLGCGGGFPVVPLATLYSDVEFTAVDSIGKKITVVKAAAEELSLSNVEAHHCRVEALDGQWDWLVSRAVAPLSELMKWSEGKWTKGMLLLKGGDLSEEIKAAGFSLTSSGLYRSRGGGEVEVIDISTFFEDEFFETKKVVVVR